MATFGEGLEVLGTDKCTKEGQSYIGVFSNSAVEDVRLPSTLKRIEYSAFRGCRHLKSIRLPDRLEKICNRCFEESGIEEIIFPASVKTIDAEAFHCCESLRSV